MKIPFYKNRDVLAGLMFIVVGCIAIFLSRKFSYGGALRMGPGYFPTWLGGIAIVGGIAVLIEGLAKPEGIGRTWSVRALIILPLTTVVFGILMTHAGFVPAVFALSFLSALASPEFKVKEQAVLATGMTLLCWALFIWVLELPYPLIRGL